MLITLILWAAVPAAAAEPVVWGTSMEAGLKESKQADAPLVLLLCKQDQQPISEADAAAARDALGTGTVFVSLRWPADPHAARTQAQQFLGWADRYEVPNLPAILVFDPQGRIVGQIASDSISGDRIADEATRLHQQLTERDTQFTAAANATGVDKARCLDRALKPVEPYIELDYRDVAEQIVALDPDNAAALRDKYRPLLVQQQLDEFIQGTIYPLIDAGQYAAARDTIAKVLETWPLSPDNHQLLLGFQAQLYYSEGKRAEALAQLDQAIELAPDSPAAEKLKHAKEQINELPDPD